MRFFAGQSYFNASTNLEIARANAILQQLIDQGKIVDLSKLSISNDENVFWHLYADITVLNCDGVPLDACLLALVSAAKCGKLPQVSLIDCRDDEPLNEHESIINDDDTRNIDFIGLGKKILVSKENRPIPCPVDNVATAATFLVLNR